MDHEHMHHDSGLGMDYNYAFAQDYWYILAGAVGVLAAVRVVHLYAGKQRYGKRAHHHIIDQECDCQHVLKFPNAVNRLKACQEASIEHATRPNGRINQAWATATAVIREISHPQFHVSKFGLRWATPPPMGRIIVLLCYWAMVIYFMVWNAVNDDAYYWERIGYRGAWVSIMQLPFIYLLSMKFNVVGFLIGSSHERLNWLHRCVARTMFVTATVHGWHFWTEWARADFVEYELQIMPSVRYGLGAWGVLLLNVVVGFLPIRRIVYEMWLVQHILSSVAMLALLSYHIPASATYLLWMSVSFLACDRAARWAMTGWQNTRWKVGKSACRCRGGMKRLGHNVHARAVGDFVTVLTIEDAHFKWHPGQHIYLWIPRLGLLESHPYTIACAHRPAETRCCPSVQLVVRAHEGFSKRLHRYAVKHPDKGLTGFVLGPLGATTNWNAYETVVLIGASTGASFTVPILEHVAGTRTRTCVRRIEVALMARRAEEMEYYAERAREAATTAREKGIEVTLHIAITGTSADGASDSDSPYADFKDSDDSNDSRNSTSTMPLLVRQYTSRPDIETLIRRPVEQAWGESAVVVCGGREIVARTRNCVSRLSDERAVHKGTGAQGIYLHVEEYAF